MKTAVSLWIFAKARSPPKENIPRRIFLLKFGAGYDRIKENQKKYFPPTQ